MLLLRRIAVPLLLVLCCLAVLVGNVAVWSWSQIGDTDTFVANVAPLADDPDIVAGVAEELSQRIVQKIPEAPEALVTALLREVLDTQLFREVWTDGIRAAHRRFLDTVDSGSDELRLDLGPVLTQVNSLLPAGLNVLDPDEIEDIDDIVVWRSDRVGQVAEAVRINNWLAWLLPPVALGLAVAALLLSTNTWRTARHLGLGIALAMALTALVTWLVRRDVLTGIRNSLERAAAEDVWDTASQRLWHQTLILLALGLALAVVAMVCQQVSRHRLG